MWASTCLLPELKIALSNAQMILDLSAKHQTLHGGAAGLWEKQRRWKPCSPALTLYLFIYFLHSPFKHDWFFEVSVHRLEGFYLLPCQRNSRFTALPEEISACAAFWFGFLAPLVISPTGMPFPRSVWISPLETLADHPSSKGIVCFSSEFLSHLSDTFLFGAIHGLSCFCWLSFQLYAF